MKRILSLLLALMLLGCMSAAVAESETDAMLDLVVAGVWNGAAAFDGTLYYTMDELGMSMSITLDEEGNGEILMDGESTGWAIQNGVAYFGEETEEGMTLYVEESRRLSVDMGGVTVLLEREGETYAEPAIPADPNAEPVAIGEEGAAYFGVWTLETLAGMDVTEMGIVMKLTLNQDGTCTLSDGEATDIGVWTIVDGVATVMDSTLFFNEAGKLVMSSEEMDMVFYKADSEGAEIDGGEGESDGLTYVFSTVDDYLGGWVLSENSILKLLLLEGEATVISGEEGYLTTWSVVDGIAEIDGMKLYMQEDGSGILDIDGALMNFERGYVEKPDTLITDGSDEGDDTDDAETGDAGETTELSENLQAYAGVWHMCYMSAGGFTGDMRSIGIKATLTLNADGTGKLVGVSDQEGHWYEEEGVVRFGEYGMPLTMLDGGFLQCGTELSGYMVFSKNETAVYTPASATTVPVEPAATAAPVAPAAPDAPAGGSVQYVGQKFVCKTYTTFGQSMDASSLGAEYALLFHENSTVDFTLAGFTVPSLPYSVTTEGVYAINYYGTMFNCVPTATGFDMDYYGTMTMHFIPAQ